MTFDEASDSDHNAAAKRLQLLAGLPLLVVSTHAEDLASKILAGYMMPQKAAADALHVAVAALARVNYLLKLNCTHIANAHELPRVYLRRLDECSRSVRQGI